MSRSALPGNPLRFWALLLVALCTIAAAASAQDGSPNLALGLPLGCTLGVDCWIAQYMDDDPGSDAVDYACGHRTYNDHNGTDFAIRDRRAMMQGVPVTAAAAGKVVRLRDGMADTGVSKDTRASVAGKNCGNGVVLQHDGGWETQYCHMKRGSIAVSIGERVPAGQKLGFVGLSGLTEFPHVHLTVRHDKATIDPFVGLARQRRCGAGEHPLWRADLMSALGYEPFTIYHAGFADRRPTPEEVRAGELESDTLPMTAPVIILWADIFGVGKEDVLTMRITGPDGAVLVERRQLLPESRAINLASIGKKLGSDKWPSGKYLGEIMLFRPITTQGGSFEKRVVREVELR